METTRYCILLLLLIVRALGQTGFFGQRNISTISSRPGLSNANHDRVDPYSAFSFLIPYNQSQSCDIYGPLCQTGSITVGVSLSNSQSTKTILPCSSYLSLQANYLNIPNIGFPDADRPFFPQEWLTGFGRSPQCSSYASVWSETGVYTFSGCTTDVTVSQQTSDLLSTFSEIPPGFLRHHEAPGYWTCCGNCSFQVQEVRLYYFPDENASAYCHSKGIPMIGDNSSSLNGSARINASSTRLDKRAATDNIAVFSGQTFTSPSLYLEIVGTAAMSDQCDFVGTTLTHPWVAIPSGQLFTYSDSLQQVGKCFQDLQRFGYFFEGTTKPLNVADLECPTFGLGPGTDTHGKPCRTVGPPYLPLIVPPSQVLSLDPGWQKACTGLLSYAEGLSSFAIYDPPIGLEPGLGLVAPNPSPRPSDPVTTLDPPSAPSTTPPIQPAQIPSADIPKPTTSDTVNLAPATNPQSPAQVADPPKPDRPAQTTVESGHPPQEVAEGDSQRTSQGLGGLIIGAFGNGPPIEQSLAKAASPDAAAHTAVLTVGDQTFVPSKSGFDIAGTPVQPGSPPIQVAGTPVSLSSSGDLYVAGSKVDVLQQEADRSSPEIFAVGDIPFVPARTGFFIAGSQVLPGSAPIYISGTPISLATSGNLVIGSSSVELESQNSAANTLEIGGETITANPTGFFVDGSQILPGSPAVLISGTPVSLGISANLVIGTSTISLSGQPYSANAFKIGDESFTANPTGFTVAGSQVLPGGSAVIVSGTTLSLNPSGVLNIGGASIGLTSPAPSADSINVGGQTFTANPTGFAIAGSQVLPGGSAVIVSGTTLSLSPAGVLKIGGASINLASQAPSADLVNVGGQIYTANPSGFQIDGSTVLPGGTSVTISGTPISLDDSGKLHVGTSSVNLVPFPSTAPDLFTVDGLTFTEESSAVAVDGVTLTAGGAATTLEGQRISLGLNGSLVVGSTTVAVPSHVLGGFSTPQPFEGGQRKVAAANAYIQILIAIGSIMMLSFT